MTTSSQRQRTEENGAAQIAGAAVLGMTLAFGFMTQQGSSATIFSLFQEGNWFRESGALLLLRVAVLGCFLFIPFQRRLYAIAGFFLVISWVTLFSVVGAFILPLATSCAFFYFAFDKSKSIRKTGATIMLAMPFLLSAIQKMHPDYLRGHEFSPNGSFFAFLYSWGLPHDFAPPAFQAALAIISIFVELGIFIGLFIRPVLFAQFALLFALLLALIHPPVIFVYGIFFPFVLLIDETWAERINQPRPAVALRQPFFWCLATIFSFIRSTDFSISAIKVWPVAALLLGYHLKMLLSSKFKRSAGLSFSELFKNPRILVAPSLVLLTFVASQSGAPSPVGFSMFSGRTLGSNTHALHVSNRETCRQILAQWTFLLVVDAGAFRNADGTCVIRFPTLSGLHGLKDRLCLMNPNNQWSVQLRGSEILTPENCDRPQSQVEY